MLSLHNRPQTCSVLMTKQVSQVISHRPVSRIKVKSGEASFTLNAPVSGAAGTADVPQCGPHLIESLKCCFFSASDLLLLCVFIFVLFEKDYIFVCVSFGGWVRDWWRFNVGRFNPLIDDTWTELKQLCPDPPLPPLPSLDHATMLLSRQQRWAA